MFWQPPPDHSHYLLLSSLPIKPCERHFQHILHPSLSIRSPNEFCLTPTQGADLDGRRRSTTLPQHTDYPNIHRSKGVALLTVPGTETFSTIEHQHFVVNNSPQRLCLLDSTIDSLVHRFTHKPRRQNRAFLIRGPLRSQEVPKEKPRSAVTKNNGKTHHIIY